MLHYLRKDLEVSPSLSVCLLKVTLSPLMKGFSLADNKVDNIVKKSTTVFLIECTIKQVNVLNLPVCSFFKAVCFLSAF